MANLGDRLSTEIALELSRLFQKATRRQMKLAGQHFNRIVESYKDNVASPPARAELNGRIAALMREKVRDAYRTNVLDVRSAPTYRSNDSHRQSGALLTALEGDSYIVGTAEDIEFQFGVLNSVASHWGRLNFGAAPGEGHSGIHFPEVSVRIQFGKNQGVSFILPGTEGSGFNIPESPGRSGFFNKEGQFFIGYPKAVEGQKRNRKEETVLRGRPSSGIGARHFLDAGLIGLRDNFATEYKKYFQDQAAKTKAEFGV